MVDYILADDSAVPAGIDELGAGDDVAFPANERDQHLQVLWLQAIAAAGELGIARERLDVRAADPKRAFSGEIDRLPAPGCGSVHRFVPQAQPSRIQE